MLLYEARQSDMTWPDVKQSMVRHVLFLINKWYLLFSAEVSGFDWGLNWEPLK